MERVTAVLGPRLEPHLKSGDYVDFLPVDDTMVEEIGASPVFVRDN